MTTRLSQRKVKGGDPAYPTLKDELDARSLGGGTGGYTVPAGGIPRSDMTADVRNALLLAESAYVIPQTGIPTLDLDSNVRASLVKANSAYQKPMAGIPIHDLEVSIQNRLNDFSSFYVYPMTGIPYVDMDSNVQSLLSKADTAYQKPATGIALADLGSDIIESLNKANSAYQKPSAGIPISDIEVPVVVQSDLIPIQSHMNDDKIHITDHSKLTGIGRYTHDQLDKSVEDHSSLISEVRRELSNARDTFASLGGRLDSILGRNSYYKIDTEEEWNLGTLQDLRTNEEGNVSFDFNPEVPVIDVFDIYYHDSLMETEKIGVLTFDKGTSINRGSGNWIDNLNAKNNIGLRLKAFVYAPKTGKYDFSIQFSGRVRVQIAAQLLFDTNNAYSQIDSYTMTDSIQLEGGRLYPIVIEGWYGTTGDRILSLMWKPPGQTYPTYIPPQFMNMSGYEVTEGIYESHIIDLIDDSISIWHLEINALEYRVDDDITAEVATSEDGITFSDWIPFTVLDAIPVPARRFSKFRLIVKKEHAQYTPLVHSFQIRYISSAVNEMREELINARETYLSLEDRLRGIDEKVQNLSNLYNLMDITGIHPEQFASTRLLQMELNMLQHFLREAEALTNYIKLEDGIVDVFKTSDFIDNALSDPYAIVNESLTQQKSLTRMNTNQDWSQWTMDRLDFLNNKMRLALASIADMSRVKAFSNWSQWSLRDTARIAGDYQDYIAQPFYTGADVSVLTRLQIQVYDAWNTPRQTVMVCPTKEGTTNEPDINNPIWITDIGYSSSLFNWTNIRIPVIPLTKYWIVVKKTVEQVYNGYARWWLSYNNTSTNARLRGTNPNNEYLYLRYSSNNGQTWLTDSGYFLTFYIDESTAFESEGYGERIIDYQRSTSFVSADFDVTDIGDGIFGVTYQTSNDQIGWSAIETDIAKVPAGRFLKVNIFMKKSSVGLGSPVLNRFDVYHYYENATIVTKAFDMKYTPTHFIFTGHDNDPDSLIYYVSRDDGHTWIQVEKDHYINLNSIQPGTQVRLKVVFNGLKPTASVHDWAYIAIRYRDVTGQNITALFEEYEATEGQTIFKTDSPYPTGNHALQVYLNGIRQSIHKDYVEIDQHTIEFTEPLIGGIDADRITFVVATGAYDVHDSSIVSRVEDLELMIQGDLFSQRKKHTYNDLNQLVQTEFLDLPYYHTVSYTYLPNGRRATETMIKGEHQRHTEYVYDDQNRISEEIITISGVTN